MAAARTLLAGMLAAVAAAALAGAAVVGFGLFDTRATTPHNPLSAWVLHTTMEQAIRRSAAGILAPRAFTGADIVAGARSYARDCSVCHGAPGVGRAAWTRGMYPPPPYLLDAARRWTRPQMFDLVRNGVKMTGMPAWGVIRSDREIWNEVAFLAALPALSVSDYARMTSDDANSLMDQHSVRGVKAQP